VTDNYPFRTDGTPHPVYVAQVEAVWRAAREHLRYAASASRQAQRMHAEAIDREHAAHREMRKAFACAGKALPV
jgi:hypothetical protein